MLVDCLEMREEESWKFMMLKVNHVANGMEVVELLVGHQCQYCHHGCCFHHTHNSSLLLSVMNSSTAIKSSTSSAVYVICLDIFCQ